MNAAATSAAKPASPFESGSRIWLVQLGVLTGLAGILYYPTLFRLVNQWWEDPNFSHGFFVPAFSAFVAWQRREELAKIVPRPSWWGIAISGLALMILVLGTLGAELFLARFSIVVLIAGLILNFLGWEHFKALLFPWACLLLMIPIPNIIFNQITFPLQFLASQLAAGLLSNVGVAVLREGNVLSLAAMKLEVAEACSGVRSLMTLGTLAVMYGYFLEPKIWKRVVLAFSSIPIAVAANALRIFGTGLCVEYWDPAKAEGFFHEFSGWIIFVLSVGLLLGVHQLLSLIGRKREVPA